jgi:integrase
MLKMDVNLKYLSAEKNRHGNACLYVRRHGKRVRLLVQPGHPDFLAAYAAALERLGVPPSKRQPGSAPPRHEKGTLGWLGAEYFKSKGEGEFLTLSADSQRRRRNDLEACFAYPHTDGDPEPMGNCPIKHLSAQKLKRLIEAKDGPGARAGRRKNLSALCSWAVENKYLPFNPVRDLKTGRRIKGGGFYTWTVPDVKQFLEHHSTPVLQSRKARLALGLLLFAGMRRQDMVTIGKQHCRGADATTLGDWIRYTPKKTLWRRREISQKPLLPILKQIITEAHDILGDLTFLVTAYGKPFRRRDLATGFVIVATRLACLSVPLTA